jgi:predicted metal-dependent HD superfamily phosphohydrolase
VEVTSPVIAPAELLEKCSALFLCTAKFRDKWVGEMGWVISAMTEPHRVYHDINHVIEMLDRFDTWRSTSKLSLLEQAAVELAVLYHDCVYIPNHPRNEEDSADAFTARMAQLQISRFTQARARQAILRTKNHLVPQGEPVSATVSDLDLAAMADPLSYKINGQRIRDEFHMVSEETFLSGRMRFLGSYLAHAPMFYTEEGQGLEPPTRNNMESELVSLQSEHDS